MRRIAMAIIALVVTGCTESTTTEPTPAVQHGRVGTLAYADPYGTTFEIHDGKPLNTSIPQYDGDPDVNADGIYLGEYVTPTWCYHTGTDNDQDRLADDCEWRLADAFRPMMSMSRFDACSEGEPYWAATLIPATAEWPNLVRIMYMPAYHADCGSHAHTADSEAIMIEVGYVNASHHWVVTYVWTSAHAFALNDHSEMRPYGAYQYPAGRSRTYPRIFVAQDKHANYNAKSTCTNWGTIDTCEWNRDEGRFRVYRGRNAGSRHYSIFATGVASANPEFSGNGRKEYFYFNPTDRGFNAWQFYGNGVTPYIRLLNSEVIDVRCNVFYSLCVSSY